MINRYLLLLVVILVVQSCVKNKNTDSIKDFIGTTVEFNDVIGDDFDKKTNKVIIYFDSTDCMSCALDNAILWEKHEKDLKKYHLNVMMLCDKSLSKEMCAYKDKYGIAFPLLWDTIGSMVHDYPFLRHKQFQTFVLNADNKIIWIGSPIYDEQVWNRFCKMMELLGEANGK